MTTVDSQEKAYSIHPKICNIPDPSYFHALIVIHDKFVLYINKQSYDVIVRLVLNIEAVTES